MKTKYFLLILVLILSFFTSCSSDKKQNADFHSHDKVSMIFPVTIEAFDQLKIGYESVCKDSFETRYFSAEGDPDKFETVIQSGLLTKPNYLVTIGTQITNTAFGPKFKNNLPIVIASAISSPDKVESLVNIGVNPVRKLPVAIISDSPKEDIFKLFAKSVTEFLPKATKVGILYNTSEINSKYTATKIKSELKNYGVTTIDGIINNADDVEKVTDNLILKNVKAIIIPLDKYAVTKAASIVKKGLSKNIPVFSLDDGTVKKDGVAIGISVNYKLIGEMIGKTLLKINQGNIKAENLPIVQLDRARIYINKNNFQKLGLNIPSELRDLIIEY